MAYPKDDNDYQDGYVTYVKDDGKDMIMVGHHMPDWGEPGGYRGCSMQPRPDFEIKEGMRIRIYAFMGIERGVYIAGRVVRPYQTKEQKHAWAKSFAKANFADRRARGKISN